MLTKEDIEKWFARHGPTGFSNYRLIADQALRAITLAAENEELKKRVEELEKKISLSKVQEVLASYILPIAIRRINELTLENTDLQSRFDALKKRVAELELKSKTRKDMLNALEGLLIPAREELIDYKQKLMSSRASHQTTASTVTKLVKERQDLQSRLVASEKQNKEWSELADKLNNTRNELIRDLSAANEQAAGMRGFLRELEKDEHVYMSGWKWDDLKKLLTPTPSDNSANHFDVDEPTPQPEGIVTTASYCPDCERMRGALENLMEYVGCQQGPCYNCDHHLTDCQTPDNIPKQLLLDGYEALTPAPEPPEKPASPEPEPLKQYRNFIECPTSTPPLPPPPDEADNEKEKENKS